MNFSKKFGDHQPACLIWCFHDFWFRTRSENRGAFLPLQREMRGSIASVSYTAEKTIFWNNFTLWEFRIKKIPASRKKKKILPEKQQNKWCKNLQLLPNGIA